MKFGVRHVTDRKEDRRSKLEIDKLAHRDREQKVRGKVKKLAGEGLKFGACCLMGAILGVVAGVAL